MNNTPQTPTDTQINAFINVNIPTMRYYWKYTSKAPFLMYKDSTTKTGIIPLTKETIIKHINGTETHGYASFIDNKNILFLGVDIDTHIKPENTEEETQKIEQDAKDTLNKIVSWLKKEGYLFFVYSSGSTGRHIQIYSNKPIEAKIGTIWLKHNLIENVKLKNLPEIFPIQHELNESVPFGSQMKAPLALHLKHNKRALVLDENGVELTIKESLDYFIDFEKKIIDAKPIEFVITPEIESKYCKKVLSTEQLETLKNQPIPKHCAFIEGIATKLIIPSQGSINRHSHIDGNVYQYCAANNKHDLFEEYCVKQERNSTAFNNAENWTFSCGAIQKYIQHYQDDTTIKLCDGMCDKCKINEKETTQETVKESIDRLFEQMTDDNKNKISQEILKLSINIDVFEQDEIVEKIHTKTKIKKAAIQEMLKTLKNVELQKTKKDIEELQTTVFLEKTGGYFVLKHSEHGFINEVMNFNSSLKYINYNIFDPKKRTFKQKPHIKVFEDNQKTLHYLTEIDDLTKRLLKIHSVTNQWKKFYSSRFIVPIHNFIKNDFENSAKKNNIYVEKRGTWCFGAFKINNKIIVLQNDKKTDYVPENDKSLAVENSIEQTLKEESNISKTNINIDEIKKYLEIIKTVPKTDEARKKWWNLFAFSLSTPLKTVLSDLGVTLFPSILLKGEAGQGKSLIYLRMLVSAPWSLNDFCNTSSLSGTQVRAVVKLTATFRPQIFDEVKDLNKGLTDLFKNSSTLPGGLGAELVRHNIDNTPRKGCLTRPLFLSANNFQLSDVAMRERIYTIPFESTTFSENRLISTDEIKYIEELITENKCSITKSIYNLYEELETNELKDIILKNKNNKKITPRTADLQSYLDVGLLIIKKLYKKYNIDVPSFIGVELYNQTTNDTIVNNSELSFDSIITDLFNNYTAIGERCINNNMIDKRVQISKFIKKINKISEDQDFLNDLLDDFRSNGFSFTFNVQKQKITHIVLDKNFKNILNGKLTRLSDNDKIPNLSSIVDRLKKIGIFCKYYDEKNVVTILKELKDEKYITQQKRCCIYIPLEKNNIGIFCNEENEDEEINNNPKEQKEPLTDKGIFGNMEKFSSKNEDDTNE